MIQKWEANITATANKPQLFEMFDYEKYNSNKQIYDRLVPEEKAKYSGLHDYILQHAGIMLSGLNNQYLLLMDEIKEQLSSSSNFEKFIIDPYDHDIETLDLLLSLEDEKHIQEIYKKKKLRVRGSGLRTSDAIIIVECLRQGRSLLQAGQKAEMLAKPLIDFYAASAYAYAIIVTNSPMHKSLNSLKGSHGHTYNHDKKTIEFGGDIPSGTFLDLLCASSVSNISQQTGQPISLKYSTLSSVDLVQKNKISLSLIPLLSMVPELRGYFSKLDSVHSSVYRISIDTSIINNNVTYNFYIGDGARRPDKSNVEHCFQTKNIGEDQGIYKIAIDRDKIHNICPQIYQDIYGELWYIESPILGLHLPELCLHFLIISALCNIMRYSPHEWSDILTNRTSSTFSLVVSQYIRIFERKFPLIVTQYLSNYNPIIKNERQ